MTKVISVLCQKGGVGKTSTVIELAYQFGVLGRRVLVVDLDKQADSTFFLVKGKQGSTSTDLLLGAPLADCITVTHDNWENCDIIPTSFSSNVEGESKLEKRINRESLLKTALKPLIGIADYILIDVSCSTNIYTLNALTASTHYLIPTDLEGEASRRGAMQIIELVEELTSAGLNSSLSCLGIIATKAQKTQSKLVRYLRDSYDGILPDNPLKDLVIPHSVTLGKAHVERTPCGKLDPENPVSVAYTELAKHVEAN